jgi:hypothetical protein
MISTQEYKPPSCAIKDQKQQTKFNIGKSGAK